MIMKYKNINNSIFYANKMWFLFNHILLDMPLENSLMLISPVRPRLADGSKVVEGTGVKWDQYLSAKVESKSNRIYST